MSDYTGMSVTRDGDAYRTSRESREARVEVALDFGAQRDPTLETSLAFFDHMLEMLGWYADAVVDATYEVKTFRLMHVVMEDVGLSLGAAAAAALRDRIADGVDSSGFAHGVMDEASALAQISFEGRSMAVVHRGGAAALERVEDVLSVDLVAFFEGFSQGGAAPCICESTTARGTRTTPGRPRSEHSAARCAPLWPPTRGEPGGRPE